MSWELLSVIKNRQYETRGAVMGIKVMERRKTLYNHAVEEALDELYFERLLEEGQCFVCKMKTSKFCYNCGTHYCSLECQRTDWHNHSQTCLGSSPQACTPTHSNFGVWNEPEELNSKNFKNTNKWNKSNYMKKFDNNNSITDRVQGNAENVPIQDVLQTDKKTTGDDQRKKDIDNGNKASAKHAGTKYPHWLHKKNKSNLKSEKKQGDGNNRTSFGMAEGHEYPNHSARKKFKIGQKLKVKCLSYDRTWCGVIEERDEETFIKIQETLSANCNNYPSATDIKKDVYAMKYNQQWHRCRVLRNDDKKLVKCIDIGAIFSPKYFICKELPDELKAVKDMAFKVEFVDSTRPELNTGYVKVEVVDFTPKDICIVKLCDNESEKENESFEKNKQKKTRNRVRKVAQIKQQTDELRRSVVDELKLTSKGIFLAGKVKHEELLGCLAPEDVDEAVFCSTMISKLYPADGAEIDAEVGENVIMAGDDYIHRRGVVESKSGDGYTVRLVDYGHIIHTSKVYRLPEEKVGMMTLACRIRLSDKSPRKFDQFEVNRGYLFEVKEKLSDDKWLCQLSIHPDSDEGLALGIVEKVWKQSVKPKPAPKNFAEFENSCRVIVSCIGEENTVFVKHVGEKWDAELEKLNLALNTLTTKSEVDFKSLQVDDLIMCKYKTDGLWYRAIVILKTEETAKVAFVDYGNVQLSTPSELRQLPDEAKNVPFFIRDVRLGRAEDSFSTEGLAYLQDIVNDSQELILTFRGSDISEGVILTDDEGIVVNDMVFLQSSKENSSDEFREAFLKAEPFQKGLVNDFVLLHVDEDEFMTNGEFWAVNGENNNFKQIISDLGKELSEHCESVCEEYIPKEQELCMAQSQDGWYRGLITNVLGASVEVFFVDFGNSETVDVKNIRKMVPKFFEVPAVAVKCNLNGFRELHKDKVKLIYSFISDNINNSLKQKVIVTNLVGNVNFVEFLDFGRNF